MEMDLDDLTVRYVRSLLDCLLPTHSLLLLVNVWWMQAALMQVGAITAAVSGYQAWLALLFG